MSKEIKRPILAKGEEYITIYQNRGGHEIPDKRPSFDVARNRLRGEINSIIDKIEETNQEYLMDDVVLTMKIDIDYSAKSYHPSPLISKINAEDIGSKKWTKKEKVKDKEKIKIGKEIFIKINKSNLQEFARNLQAENYFNKAQKDNIRSIEELYFDNHEDLIRNFKENWNEGQVEFVLHPFGNKSNDVKEEFFKLLQKYGGDINKVKFKQYDSGITFVSAILNKKVLREIIKFNPIRTAHPIEFRQLPTIRSLGYQFQLPKPHKEKIASSINLGIFDGGMNADNPYFLGFAEEYNLVNTHKEQNSISHGSGVVSAALWGNLAKYNSNDILPIPKINVKSFRVLPLNDNTDIDLYEAIDLIEEEVPKHRDIKVYNLSFGPYGPIEDDCISRFTYALDRLSKDGDKLFVVAVGNDGELPDEFGRIQSPADGVNCLGVGAYTKNYKDEFERAPYSCYGDGREGCKIKPDLLDFGGTLNNAFQLISSDGKSINASAGTSFASPLVAAKAAEIEGRLEYANSLLARALLVHTAKHPDNKADKYMGHGIANPDVDDILSCANSEVTTIYQAKIMPKSSIKLELPYITGLDYNGKVRITWTIALATDIEPQNTEDYTSTCIEDTFYPNVNKFGFYKITNGKKRKRTINIETQREEYNKLIQDGWIIEKTPNAYSDFDNKYKPESERKRNFKWDTIIKRTTEIKYSNLNNPYIVLHAMDRGKEINDYVKYAVVASLDYEDCKEDVYDLTLREYNKLEISEIKNVNEILIRI